MWLILVISVPGGQLSTSASPPAHMRTGGDDGDYWGHFPQVVMGDVRTEHPTLDCANRWSLDSRGHFGSWRAVCACNRLSVITEPHWMIWAFLCSPSPMGVLSEGNGIVEEANSHPTRWFVGSCRRMANRLVSARGKWAKWWRGEAVVIDLNLHVIFRPVLSLMFMKTSWMYCNQTNV